MENSFPAFYFLIMLHPGGLQLYLKESADTMFFCEFCRNLFVKHLQTAASENGNSKVKNTVRNLSKICFFPYSRASLLLIFFHIQQQYFTTSNLALVVFFSSYSRFSSFLKTVPYISKSVGNDAFTMNVFFLQEKLETFSRPLFPQKKLRYRCSNGF